LTFSPKLRASLRWRPLFWRGRDVACGCVRDSDSPWNDPANVEKLIVLHKTGMSLTDISRQFQPPLSKNAVGGKIDRLALPKRPSPIKGRATGDNRQQAPKLSPAALPSLGPAVAPTRLQVPRMVDSDRQCCWPIGDPGTPGFRFCEAERAPGKPYCPACCTKAYVRVAVDRQDAA